MFDSQCFLWTRKPFPLRPGLSKTASPPTSPERGSKAPASKAVATSWDVTCPRPCPDPRSEQPCGFLTLFCVRTWDGDRREPQTQAETLHAGTTSWAVPAQAPAEGPCDLNRPSSGVKGSAKVLRASGPEAGLTDHQGPRSMKTLRFVREVTGPAWAQPS